MSAAQNSSLFGWGGNPARGALCQCLNELSLLPVLSQPTTGVVRLEQLSL